MQRTGWLVLASILEVHSELVVIVTHAWNVENKGSKRLLFAAKVQHVRQNGQVAMVFRLNVRVFEVMVRAEGNFLPRL